MVAHAVQRVWLYQDALKHFSSSVDVLVGRKEGKKMALIGASFAKPVLNHGSCTENNQILNKPSSKSWRSCRAFADPTLGSVVDFLCLGFGVDFGGDFRCGRGEGSSP